MTMLTTQVLLTVLLPMAPHTADEPVSFQRQVAPMLVAHCVGCHNDQKAESGLNMATFAKMLKGGEVVGEGIIESGKPEQSHLIAVVRPDAEPRMPLKQEPLSDTQIALLERWVAEGAKFDGPSAEETPLTALVDPLTILPRRAASAGAVEPVTALAYTPDGSKLLAARGLDVLVIDPAEKKTVATLSGHPGPISAIQVTGDGSTLVVAGGRAGQFGAVAVWDLKSNEKLREFRGHADTILSASLSSDDTTLATSSYDRLIKLWNIHDGSELRTLKEHTDAVYGVAFSPDGTRLASVAGDRTLKLWDPADGRRIVSLSDATAELYAVAYAANGRSVIAGGVDRTLRAWRLGDGDSASLERSAFAHDGPIVRLTLSPDGKTLVSASEDRTVKLWDAATLDSRLALPAFADWPLALAVTPDNLRLALGLYDGTAVLHDLGDGARQSQVLDKPMPKAEKIAAEAPAPAPKPELVRNATLDPPTPRGAARGSTIIVRLNGLGVGKAESIWFTTPAITARLVPLEKPEPNAIQAELTLPADLPPAMYPFWVRTPLGTPPPRLFAVSAWPETAEAEANDAPAMVGTTATQPTTWTGAIDKPGDIDHVRFEAAAGQTLVAGVAARELGSALNASLALVDESGQVLARAVRSDDGREPILTYHAVAAGPVFLRVADTDLGGSGNHFYRIAFGSLAHITAVTPLGIAPGSTASLVVEGENLETSTAEGSSAKSTAITVSAETPIGTMVPVSVGGLDRLSRTQPWRVVVAAGPQAAGVEPDDDPTKAALIAAPGGLSGVLGQPGDVDHAKFNARRGERWVIEVYGRRLGSPIDPIIEIENSEGQTVARAVARPVRETLVAFRDHPSTGRNIRLTWPWTGFNQGDHVLMGRELMRIHELPRGPDDDAVFWGLGNSRNNTGERIAFMGTTPEHHPVGQPIYKVELHPAGTTFPRGGVAPVTLYYRNDDGGPGFDKDSRLIFDAPADGTYVVRIEDVRGLGGPSFGYHLVIRPAQPDFRIASEIEDVNIPRGSATVVPVALTRLDAFEGPVDVSVENLPPGITATATRVEEDQYSADLLFEASSDAPDYPVGNWTLVARSASETNDVPAIEHTFDPGGPERGWITVTPEPNLRLTALSDRVQLRPGQETTMTIRVERRNGFAGRVPIEVRNLPFGVRVLDIGLNGVLVTEQQTERSFTLYAEPWVKPQERLFYAVAKCEAAGTDHPAAPIPLVVLPPSPPASAAAR